MRTLLTPLACLAFAAPVFAEPVSGRVVNADGSPASGAQVATFWNFQAGAATAHNAATTADDGAFQYDVNFYNRPTAIMAMNAERTRGGIIVVAPDQAGEQHTITLGPLVEVKGDFYCEEFEHKPTWTNVYLSLVPEGEGERPLRVAGCMSQEAEFTLALPPGEYQFWAYGTDVQNFRENITLSADEPLVDRGTVNLEPTIIARHYGKPPPPLHITEARGIDKDIILGDLKGKWALLEFWGFW